MTVRGAYYNEIDPKAAAWLRELIRQGHIAPGDVDERSIEDVTPIELAGYAQCHFFAGIGVWSYALRRAGWADDRPVWTGSCPCQPFSAAGKGGGFDDERHLWPAFHWLIAQCRPDIVFGEQVASKDGLAWFDLVQADLEGSGYANGAVDFCSAGVGAPHIRRRLYWFGERLDHAAGSRHVGAIAGAEGTARDEARSLGEQCETSKRNGPGEPCGLADADGGDASAERQQRGGEQRQQPEDGGAVPARPTGPVNGFWGASDWLHCRDHKWRPVMPGSFPLAHGAPARVVRLRGYGNAINAEAATTFIEAFQEARELT